MWRCRLAGGSETARHYGVRLFLLAQYWPILAVLIVGLVPFIAIQMWRGRLRLSQIALFLSIEAMLAVAAQQVLTETGLISLFDGKYNAESVEAFNQVCLLGCQPPIGGINVCPRYCGCVITRGRQILSYKEMLARTTGLADDHVDAEWAQIDQTCRRDLGLR